MSLPCRIQTTIRCLLNSQHNRVLKQQPQGRYIHRSVVSKKNEKDIEENNEPIKFSSSQAAQTSIIDKFTTSKWKDTPKYEPYFVGLSLIALLVYFTILREENDLDEEMGQSIYTKIEGLEENHLKHIIEYNSQNGIPYAEHKKRLDDIIAKKNSNMHANE